MASTLSPVIKPSELLLLRQTKPIVLIEASAGPGSKQRYAERHLAGALYADLELQLANTTKDAAYGGRHPLPEPAEFSKVLKQLGIGPASHVIIYDDKNGSNAAARLWWMLRSAGHQAVQVIDGGFDAAVAAGFPISQGEESPVMSEEYEFTEWLLPLADMQEVEKVAKAANFIVIDVRDPIRFRGEKEPIDLIAGHIPGAVNIPFTDNLDGQGFYLPPTQLKQKYSQVLDGKGPDQVIVHCGSGVTACHTLLAMAYADMEIPKLYVGSWSEWSRNDQPIGTGN